MQSEIVNPQLTTYYNQIKNNKHIFIYAVAGRSSSTFLQRLLNSSGEVCIYGEFHYLIDKLLDTLHQMMQMNQGVKGEISEPWMIHTKNSHDEFVKALQSGKHDTFYPNAIRDMDVSIEMLKEALANILRPLNDLERFGYKEIRLQNIHTLKLLRELFPDSYFIFQFRDPLEQWNSIKNFSGSFPYSKDCKSFIIEYEKLANLYISSTGISDHHQNYIFVSENTLSDQEKIQCLIRKLDLSKFDQDLILKKVGSSKNNTNIEISREEKELILNSQAYNYYLKMSGIEITGQKESEIMIITNQNLQPNFNNIASGTQIKNNPIKRLLSKSKQKIKSIFSTNH